MLADQLEARIRANRLLNLPATWADELIFPYYDGLSLANIPQTITHLLGAGTGIVPQLNDVVWHGESLVGQIDRVVVFLTDGLGYLWLRQLIKTDSSMADNVADLTDGRGPVPLTSIAPSTTAVALPTLWTGASPAMHGMVGTRMFLREFSVLSDMLAFKPAIGSHRNGIFEDWGMPPETFLPVQTLAERLAEVGVETHLLLPKALMRTGLSRIMHRGVTNPHIHAGYTDLWLRMKDVLTETAGQRCYMNVYWSAVDSMSHLHGAHNRYLEAEIRYQLEQLRLLANDPAVQDGRTLFIVLADHGHYDTPQPILLNENERASHIWDAMRGGFGAESRFIYLYLRDGYKQQVIDTVEAHFANCLTWIEPTAALDAGLFGPGVPYREIPHRLGDLILAVRAGFVVGDPSRKFSTISRHGGLSDWEMLIPLMWKRI